MRTSRTNDYQKQNAYSNGIYSEDSIGLRPEWITIKQAANYASVSERTIRSWLKDGLSYSKASKKLILIRIVNIDNYLLSKEVNSSHCEVFKKVDDLLCFS
ncbi:hypothetical protein SAMN05660420_02856 [Desulfuromusa kysingii]|uniref:Helix-turn-helix domain-containing protein n=1 Tax=Desulfuromusa kysingii TaxID=37625 RepID=A0A1H4D608_9BACT|nr:helix-turn-helix domain-containing protein [Desulfuromusa kysingii]SEA68164.1 hypothetical protein SAMN05660420_02856 [Desulfuromusa kysingii]